MSTRYEINGRPVPRVTEVLQQVHDEKELEDWKKRTPGWEEKTKRAMMMGTLMHWALANEYSPVPVELGGDLPLGELPEDALEELAGRLKQWERLRMNLAPMATVEHVVYIDEGEDCQAGGTLDWRGTANGYKAIIDWKGSKKIRPEYLTQIGAYALGSRREGVEVERGYVVRLLRDEREVAELDKTEIEEEGEKFKDLCRRWWNGRR